MGVADVVAYSAGAVQMQVDARVGSRGHHCRMVKVGVVRESHEVKVHRRCKKELRYFVHTSSVSPVHMPVL